MYHDGCRIADGIKAPDPFEQCILAENDAPVLGQKEKQFEFFICQGNFPFCDEDAMLFRPDLQITAAEEVVFVPPFFPVRRSYRVRCALTRATSSPGLKGLII